MAKGEIRQGSASLKKVLEIMIQDMGLEPKLRETKLLDAIPDLLGATICKLIIEKYVYERKLYLKTHSAVLRNELFVIKDALLLKIQQDFGKDLIDDIVVR
jgi:hypothetical protein